jgi:hypothetical protein
MKILHRFCIFVFLCMAVTSFGQASSPGEALEGCEVCVYGATPSGIYAAIAAAREGRRVVLIEPSCWVGGMLGAGIKPGQDCPLPAAVGGLMREGLASLGKSPVEVRKSFHGLLEKYQIRVLFEHRVAGVEKQKGRIVAIQLEHAPPDAWGVPAAEATDQPPKRLEARVYIDASYEGDVMARAGVSYATGRESRQQYDEPHAGVQAWTNLTPISPHVSPGDPGSGLLRWVETDHGQPLGAADDYTQAYNFRYYVTDDPARRQSLTPPENYDPADFELVGRYVQYLVQRHRDHGGPPPRLDQIFPGWLNSGEYNYFRQHLVTMAPLGVSRIYQDADYAARSRIWRWHIDYLRGLHHFLSTDSRVPAEFRRQTARLGLDRSHHADTQGWPHQLYVRVCRRMIGRYVLTEADVMNRTQVDDSVGLALYGVDTYPVRRVAVTDLETGQPAVATEGNMFIGGNRGTGVPYAVPYRAITPKRAECRNLLVPVCFSASYVAYASARMEPVFAVLGESAGVAAAQAVEQGVDVQEVNVTSLQQRLRDHGQVLEYAPAPRASPPTDKTRQAPRQSGGVEHEVLVEKSAQLRPAIESADDNTTILIADGEYRPGHLIAMRGKRNVTIRGASGDPTKVVIRGQSWDSEDKRDDILRIGDCEKITIAYVTFADCHSYAVKVEAEHHPRDIHIHHCHFRDIGTRAIKGSGGDGSAQRGSIRHCHFENTKVPPADWLFGGNYISAIDMMALDQWVISDNVFRNIKGRTGGGRAAIFIWVRSQNVTVERNLIVNCDRGIALGNPSASTSQVADGEFHVRHGICRNNFIVPGPDAGIELWWVNDVKVYHNTIWRPEGTGRGIRYGARNQQVHVANNLIRGQILADGAVQTDGAAPPDGARLENNVTGPLDGYFADPAVGDLRLTPAARRAIDAAVPLAEVTEDFFGDPRGERPDVGAHERDR